MPTYNIHNWITKYGNHISPAIICQASEASTQKSVVEIL